MSTAEIYVSDYNTYNNGFLHGKWISLEGKTSEEIKTEIQIVLDDNSQKIGDLCEEPMFQDFEGFHEAFYDESGINFDRLVEYLELDEYDREKVDAILEFYLDTEYALEHYQDVIIYDSWNDIIDEWIEVMEIPERAVFYIDEEKLIRDLQIESNYHEMGDGRVVQFP